MGRDEMIKGRSSYGRKCSFIKNGREGDIGKGLFERSRAIRSGRAEEGAGRNTLVFEVYRRIQVFYTASVMMLKHKVQQLQQSALWLTWKQALILNHARRHNIAKLPPSSI